MKSAFSFFVLRFAISQAGIAPRTLILMQGSEEKKYKNAGRIEPERETWRTRALTATPQRATLSVRQSVEFTVTRLKGKKVLDGRYICTLC